MKSIDEQDEAAFPALTLFVTGDAPRSRRARKNLQSALQVLGLESINPLEVDLLQQPEKSINNSVFATPALLKTETGGTVSIIYGDLSDERKLLDFLHDITGP